MTDNLTVPLYRVTVHAQTGTWLGEPVRAGDVVLAEFIQLGDTADVRHDVRMHREEGLIEVRAIEEHVARAPRHWPFPTFLGEKLDRPATIDPTSVYPFGAPEAPL